MGRLPNFFIVGAAKAGTTSLYIYLAQHPQIYLSKLKEPKHLSLSANNFPHSGPGDTDVDDTIIKTWDEYLDLFKNADTEIIIGEASADYLYFHDTVIPIIKKVNPESKILIMLRNPIDRAFSAYRHMLKDKRESLSFEKALKIEEQRKKDNYEFIWFYKDVGFYYDQVNAYLNSFDKQNVKVCLYDDFNENAEKVLKGIFRFLGIKDSFLPDTTIKYNVSNVAKNNTLNKFLKNYEHPIKKLFRPLLLNMIGINKTEALINYLKHKNLVTMNTKTRKKLLQIYKDDLMKLQDLINRDLSEWLQ